jgi:MYXO-CTERM domain-containing protein
MKTFGLSLIVVGLALAALPASAQDAGQTTFALETHSEAGSGYFTLAGETARNPTLVVPAGETITVTLTAMDGDGVHNIQVDGASASEYVQAEGDEVIYTFTAPASGTKQYFCFPHRSAGMGGTVQVAGSETTPENGSPALPLAGLAVALLGAALLLRRK